MPEMSDLCYKRKPQLVVGFVASPDPTSQTPELLRHIVFKRNEWLVVLAEKVKIEYFSKKIFNYESYVSVDNDTIKILKEI